MNSKELFEMHQEILSEILEGKPFDIKLEKKIKEFLLITNSKIDAFCLIARKLSYTLDDCNDLAKELCSMRDLITTEKNKRGEI